MDIPRNLAERYLFMVPPHPWVLRVAMENLDFDQAMISLAACGYNLEAVTIAFKKWVITTPFPWRVAVDYCRERAAKGASLPFTVSDS